MKKRKICVFTGARSEYGLLRWLMEEIKNDNGLTLQIVATGAHLSNEMGLTYKEIEKDGFRIDEKIETLLSSSSEKAITKSMGLCIIGISEAFERLRPDILVVLGDRYELLSVCSVAIIMKIPIAHISGGDITEGSMDNQIRHAVTKMSHLHFPSTEESANRIIWMGEKPERVFVVGEPGLDNFKKLKILSRKRLTEVLNLDKTKRWVLFTYHPETMIPLRKDLERMNSVLEALDSFYNIQIIMTYPSADIGSVEIIEKLKEVNKKNPQKFKLVKNLGQLKYISLMNQVYCMVGNSSSGIVESTSAKIPAINVGGRQKGRITTKNVINVDGSHKSIREAFQIIKKESFRNSLKKVKNPYGNGRTAEKIKKILKEAKMNDIVRKGFYIS